jgi:hypothetical protein
MRPLRLRRQTIFEHAQVGSPIPAPRLAGTRFILVDQSNVLRVQDYRSNETAQRFLQYLDDGRVGVYALVNERVVGHGWATVAQEKSTTVNGFFRLLSGQALIHDCNVEDDARGNNIYPSLIDELRRHLELSYPKIRVLIDSEMSNTGSLKGITKAGFIPVGHGYYVQVSRFTLLRHQRILASGSSR